MVGGVLVVLIRVLSALPASIGQAKSKPALSNSAGINRLSLARPALCATRDVWFVVSVPVFLSSVLGWDLTDVGAFLAAWVIAYGGVPGLSPAILRRLTGDRGPGAGLVATPGGGHCFDSVGASRGLVSVDCDARGPRLLRHRLRPAFCGALVYGAGLLRSRPRLVERRLLLHGRCRRAAHGHRCGLVCCISGRASRRPCGAQRSWQDSPAPSR